MAARASTFMSGDPEELGEGKLPGKAGQLQDLQDKAKSLRDKAKTLADKGVGELLEEELKGAVREQQEKINSKLKEAVIPLPASAMRLTP